MIDPRNLPRFSLEVDADRDGILEPGEPGHWDWNWTPEGPGAIALPDLGQGDGTPEMTPARLVVTSTPPGSAVRLGISALAAPFVTVYRDIAPGNIEPILGRVDRELRMVYGPITSTTDLLVQPRQLPGLGFDGVIELTAQAIVRRPDGNDEVGGRVDRALLRVAPWIMTPNTCKPRRVYAVIVPMGAAGENQLFREELSAACTKAKVPLTLLDISKLPQFRHNQYDRWIQDEIEFGYVASPSKIANVVVDGPRNRGLDTIGGSDQLGPNIGSVLLDADFDATSSLDAFGNLEVSPPVVSGGIAYPLGRIVLGTKLAQDPTGEQASLRLRQFLYEQRVQTPFEVHTDWLAVGHVDEIISFVPAATKTGFRVLVASPKRAHEILADASARGDGKATLWRGQKLDGDARENSAEETVDQLLGKSKLWAFNAECQGHIKGVLTELKTNLGIGDDDLVDIPVIFESQAGFAGAYFPDMVNHLVLGNISVVPRPYGAIIGKVDIFEQAFRHAVPDRDVIFIDDWLSYHKVSGEVHCGTNVLREPITDVRWWEHKYPGVYNLWDTAG